MKLAYYQEKAGEKCKCCICPNYCLLSPGQQGLCHGRKNVDGDLFSMNYGTVSSISLDPMEKKPLRGFHPGSSILSVGTFGCNFHCDYCQNWSISQSSMEDISYMNISAEELIAKALELIPLGNIGIAFTYNEPTIWYEYVLDTAIKAREANLKVVLVTNGFINPSPLEELLPYVDAMNIDLKAFNATFYEKICGGNLETVKNTIQLACKSTHVEISTLLISGLNDNSDEIEGMAKWLSEIDPEMILHLSRYFPRYKRKEPPATPLETLQRCQLIAHRYLKNVFLGNV